jgi:hypothetical protein
LNSSAEQLFRDAFDRLKRGVPQRLPRGSPVSQNNVAKEAGCDPSALKKSRYPELVKDIQLWVAEFGRKSANSASKQAHSARRRSRSLKAIIDDLKAQRDLALSMLVHADATILELVRELELTRNKATRERR